MSLERVNFPSGANTKREYRSYLVHMNCGSPARPPPRRPAATGRLAGFACLFLLAAALWVGPAGAVATCGAGGSAGTRSGHGTGAGDENCAPSRAKRTADPMSFLFFIGMMIAVVVVPVALNKRLERPLE